MQGPTQLLKLNVRNLTYTSAPRLKGTASHKTAKPQLQPQKGSPVAAGLLYQAYGARRYD
eukprot:7027415-Pyramimonas_sp.AAC.1